jgi:hypothetical protein
MPGFNGSGTFQRVRNWVSDAAAGIKIRADYHDSEDDNFAAGLSFCLTKDGQTTPTGDIKLGGWRLTSVGNPINPQDAVTLNYLTTTPFTVQGNDAVGRISFAGSQTDATGTSVSPLGISFTQSAIFAGVRRNVTTTDGERTPRFFVAGSANPADQSLDLFSVDAAGVHIQATLAWNTYYAGTPAEWRAQTAGFGGFLTFDKTTGFLGYYVAPASVGKDADITYKAAFTIDQGKQTLCYTTSLMAQAPTGNVSVACYNTALGAYGMYVRAANSMGFGSLAAAGNVVQEWMSLGTAGAQLFYGGLSVPGRINADSFMYTDNSFGFYQSGTSRLFVYSGNFYWTFNTGTGDLSWIRSNTTNTYIRGSDGHLVHLFGASKPGGGPWTDTSDARVKDVSGPYEHGLAEVRQLVPQRYTFKGNDGRHVADGKPYIGLIAQATEGPMPEMVARESGTIDGAEVDDLRILDTSPLIYAVVNSCKELADRLEVVEDQLAARDASR